MTERAPESARVILDGFISYQGRFREITRRAKQRFEKRDWSGLQTDASERLDLYKNVVDQVVANLHGGLESAVEDKAIWAIMKAHYSELIADREDWDLAETFFNSITRRIFSTVGLDANIEYVDTDFESPPTAATAPVYRAYTDHGSAAELLEQVMADYSFDVPYADLGGDAAAAADQLISHLPEVGALRSIERVEMVRSVFYRGQRAFLVGRVYSGLAVIPLILALANTDHGILVDAVLLEEDDVSTLFSFTRAYFHVEADRPYDLVRFLAALTPRKRSAELYISIGYNKHGKTGLYRDLFRHLALSDQQFEFARGTRGLVMVAFTMPGYDIVFKVIRDSFDPPKQTTRQSVKDKYQLVFRHDRAGRLVDAQEFEHLKFERIRFTDALLTELLDKAGRSVSVVGDHVVIDHAYLERRVIPLNLYVREASEEAARSAVSDYGQTIKDLAAADIFPGRHAPQELRSDPARPGGLLRLRRIDPAAGVQFSGNAGANHPGTRDGRRALVLRRGRTTSSPRSSGHSWACAGNSGNCSRACTQRSTTQDSGSPSRIGLPPENSSTSLPYGSDRRLQH